MTPMPDLNARLEPKEKSRLTRQFMIAALNAKADWMERTMKPIMPRDIYRMVWDTSGSASDIEQRQAIVKKYLKSQDIRIEESGLNARIMKGTQQVGQAFYVKLVEK